MIRIHDYTSNFKEDWNAIVSVADNGHFMMNRDYMEYHADRFQDSSLVIFKQDRLIGVIPGNSKEEIFYTHQGLTFGGIVLHPDFNRACLYSQIFKLLFETLKNKNFKEINYKCIPHIYHENPCEADQYFLRNFSTNIQSYVELSTSIDLRSSPAISQLRIRGKKKAEKSEILVQESQDIAGFWKILSERLDEKYKKNPVHTLDEIDLLQKQFPNNIKLFTATHPVQGLCGGVMIYETKTVAHAQYISANSFGMENGALDALFFHLIEQYRKKGCRFFDFGISTEQKGQHLNEPLIQFKEGFGGRSIIYVSYVLKDIQNWPIS